ncbi:CapA family protein [Peribacillus sp. SCS-155]|uniref:CapA family protein n=1 Tax=Peribacillus sedimenti TaxID=3115297 RepID=UPI003905CDB5
MNMSGAGNRQSQSAKRRRRLRRPIRRFLLLAIVILTGIFAYKFVTNRDQQVTQTVIVKESSKSDTESQKPEAKKEKQQEPEQQEEQPSPPEPVTETIKISAAGDFTLGTDESFAYTGSFPDEADNQGLSYFAEKLDNIFKKDDFSSVNLETTLTNATQKAEKTFRFKGDPSYVKILQLAGIESVNLANNHIKDYLEKGYEDTKAVLKNNNVGYFGYENEYVTTVKGVKIGALGYEGWQDTPELRNKVSTAITNLRNQGVQIVLVHFHWGIESNYVPNESQKTLARFTIDSGADLILGHHPHVVQGIEEYKGRYIVYSLGNFMFGGNRNPRDKDTFVFQQTFYIENGKLSDKKDMKIIPFSISSVSSRNNYQPTLLKGAEADRVLKKVNDLSEQIN